MEILSYLKSELPTTLYNKLEPDLKNLLETYKQEVESDTLHSVACYWSVDDVLSINPLYSEDEAVEILNKLDGTWDASVGASWDDLEYACARYGQPQDFYPLVRQILAKLTDPRDPEFEYLLGEVEEHLVMCGCEVYPLLAEYRKHHAVPLELLELIKKILNELTL